MDCIGYKMADEELLLDVEIVQTVKNLCSSKSERRSVSAVSAGLRKSLQTCKVQENEEKLDSLLEFYKKKKKQP